ncbi:AAA family ATPase [Halomonas getboli]|uniref:AAA family ATPase n=1 Tax=Halomonas getboli TaxID=2935862 RepID=UPI001FFFE547|nr:bifunctional aminoglycoside phosphotransferase/ATP-binding protein [Halomonas getboli]MCK2185022.1 AAA family ATPase [Halomonas getboli]
MNQRHAPESPARDFTLETLVESLSAWHADHAVEDDAEGLQVAVRRRVAVETQALASLMMADEDRQRLSALSRWLEENLARLASVLEERETQRLPRSWACDHRGGRLLDDGRVVMVNAIDRDLLGHGAEIVQDPVADLASLLVGLEVRDEARLANQALDAYLRHSGDYRAARLLSLFRVLECLAGARRALRRLEAAEGDDERPALRAETMGACRRYLELAERHAEFRFPPLVIGVGVSGSGKSRFTRSLVARLGAVRVSSYAERRRLHGLSPQGEPGEEAVDIFSVDATERTYQRLARCAGSLLDAGLPACIDATCLAQAQRDWLRHQAESRGLPVLLVSFEADQATLTRRITKRAGRYGATAEDGLTVLSHQQERFESFSDEERYHLVRLDTTADNAGETLAGMIQEHMHWS